jgi:hypothetical protein
MQSFLQRYAPRIHGVLHGFDRLRFRGTFRDLAFNRGMSGFLFAVGVAFKNFSSYVNQTTQQVRQATSDLAQAAGRPLEPFRTSDKEAHARAVAKRDGITSGLIGIFSATESCFSYEVRSNRASRRLELFMRPRKCLHYYHYHLHPQFGLMHLRLQTWFPFSMQICINGREWLARQLKQEGIAYRQRDNCLLELGDVAVAQRLADAQTATDWPKMLGPLARQANPAHDAIFRLRPKEYYWSVEQSEWASDVFFKDPNDLAQLYKQLVHHGIEHLCCADVLRFLGRQQPGTSEIHSSKKIRPEGTRLKHWVNGNSIKMYDKDARALRIETTLNDVRDFRTYRTKEGAESGAQPEWLRMRKGVADLPRRAEVSQAANERYLEVLATVEETQSLAELTAKLCRSTRWNGQRVRALNPLADKDAALLAAVNRGEFAVNGFRNRDLRPLLFGASPAAAARRRRQASSVTRQLRLLRAHGLIGKVPRTHRYVLTEEGRRAITAILTARQASPSKLAQSA